MRLTDAAEARRLRVAWGLLAATNRPEVLAHALLEKETLDCAAFEALLETSPAIPMA